MPSKLPKEIEVIFQRSRFDVGEEVEIRLDNGHMTTYVVSGNRYSMMSPYVIEMLRLKKK